MIFLAHDGHHERRPACEGMRAFTIASNVVVMFPNVSGAPIFGHDVIDDVLAQLGVDFTR